MKGREGKGREGKGREGKGRGGKGREGKEGSHQDRVAHRDAERDAEREIRRESNGRKGQIREERCTERKSGGMRERD